MSSLCIVKSFKNTLHHHSQSTAGYDNDKQENSCRKKKNMHDLLLNAPMFAISRADCVRQYFLY